MWEDAERLGGPVLWMQRSEITGGFVNSAIPFMNRAVTAPKPFFVNLWPDDVHSPYWPPVEQWAKNKRGLYLAVLEEMDRQLGRLFDHLRNTPALRDNTLVLICSDNGPEPNVGSAGPFRGSKTTLYEGGTRSPLIVWAPGLFEKGSKGTVNQQSIIAAIDLLPSILSIAKIEVKNVRFDGENMAQVLLGHSNASRTAPIFWRRHPDRKTVSRALPERLPDLAMRDGNWKFLCDYDGSKPQLYELTKDPGDSTNVAGKHPDLVSQMSKSLLTWHLSLPPDNGPALGREEPKIERKR